MAAVNESAADVRAIRTVLRERTATGLLPFFQGLTWAPQNPNTRPLHAAEPRLLIGHSASDESAIYAHYLTTAPGNKVIVYYKDGGVKELYRYVLDNSNLKVPFRYLMELELTDTGKHSIVGAYIKASFSLKGVTQDVAYEPTSTFENLLGRAVVALGDAADAADRTISTAGDGLQTHRTASSALSLTSASTSSKHSLPVKAPTSHRQYSSSSSSQALEENTIDLDEYDTSSWKGTLGRDADRIGSTSQFGMFSHAKSRSRPQQDGIASRPIDSQSAKATTKRKSLGMFHDALSAKRVNMGSSGRRRVIGESSAGNTARTYLPMNEDEGFFLNCHPTAVKLDSKIGRAVSLAIRPNSRLDRATRERSTTSSLSSPPSSPINPENQEGNISLNGTGTIYTRNETECFDLDKQAQDYLEMEKFIDQGDAKIAVSEKKAHGHLLKQTASGKAIQGLEEEVNTIEEQFEEEGFTRKEEVWKRLKAQIAVEIATIDEDISKKIALGTAKIHEEMTALARSIEESFDMRREEEAKMREEQHVVAKTRERLQALKIAGGFDLGEVVNAKRQQRN